MQTCKTCIHWKEIDEEINKIKGGICNNTSKITERWNGKEYQKDSLVYPYTESGDFWTGPEFGCVHHNKGQNQ